MKSPPEWPAPGDYFRVWVTDTNGADNDLILHEPRQTAPPDCPIEPSGEPRPEGGTGDYFVRDAQP